MEEVETEAVETEEDDYMKVMQKHFFKTLVGAFAIAIVGAAITSFTFYYKTNDAIGDLTVKADDNATEIGEVKTTVDEIQATIAADKTAPAVLATEVVNINKRLDDWQKRQDRTDERIDMMNSKMDKIVEILLENKKP